MSANKKKNVPCAAPLTAAPGGPRGRTDEHNHHSPATGPQEQGLRQREGHRTVVLPHATIAARRWTRNGLREAPRSLPVDGPGPLCKLVAVRRSHARRHATRRARASVISPSRQPASRDARTHTHRCVCYSWVPTVCVSEGERERERESVCVFAKHPTPRVYPASPLSRRRAIQQTTTRSGTFGAVPSRGDLQPVPRIFTA